MLKSRRRGRVGGRNRRTRLKIARCSMQRRPAQRGCTCKREFATEDIQENIQVETYVKKKVTHVMLKGHVLKKVSLSLL